MSDSIALLEGIRVLSTVEVSAEAEEVVRELESVLEALVPRLVDELPPGSKVSLLPSKDSEVEGWEELVILATVPTSAGRRWSSGTGSRRSPTRSPPR